MNTNDGQWRMMNRKRILMCWLFDPVSVIICKLHPDIIRSLISTVVVGFDIMQTSCIGLDSAIYLILTICLS